MPPPVNETSLASSSSSPSTLAADPGVRQRVLSIFGGSDTAEVREAVQASRPTTSRLEMGSRISPAPYSASRQG